MVNNEKFMSVGFVNPGGRTSDVLKERNVKEEFTNKEDLLVIVSGTNDIAGNEGGDALAKIKETLDKYDLVDWSCVNLVTKKINEELKGLSEAYNNVTMVEASKAERHLHTSHGMHLNPKGKTWLAEKICEAAGIGSIQLEHLPSSNLRTPVDSTINLGNDKSTQEDPPPLTLSRLNPPSPTPRTSVFVVSGINFITAGGNSISSPIKLFF
ncbi:hypothetical protein J6590_031765 [Homalodisca vitripennis]|nr:hypothetical protein J6590_031765 [Homalodisca vitripennis]